MTSFKPTRPERFRSSGVRADGKDRNETVSGLPVEGATVSRAGASGSTVFHIQTLIGLLSIAGCTSIALPSVASDVVPPANEGWESPAKLKPYVKLQPDGSSSSTGSQTEPAGDATKKGTIQATPADAANKELDTAVKSIMQDSGADVVRVRKDRKAAKRLAKYQWLDKSADANPMIIEAITMHKSAAKILAKHPRLAHIAEADHYTCRRITKYKPAARLLAANGDVKEVAALDPEGLYDAIKRDKKIIRILSRNPIFDQMIVENPDLARVISKYM